MKIIRWLLSHTFLILLIVGVIYGYIYWGNLLGKETPVGKTVAYLSGEFVEVKDFVDAIKAKQARLNTERSSENQLPVSAKLSGSTAVNEVSQAKEVVVIESSPDEIIIAEKSSVLVAEESVELAQPGHQQSIQPEQQEPEQQSEPQAEQQQPLQQQPEQNQLVQSEPEQQESPQQQPESIRQISQDSKAASATSSVAETTMGNSTPEHSELPLTNGAVSNKGVFVSHEEAKQLNRIGIGTQGKKLDKPQHFDRVRADWMTARKSFHQRNYALSEQSYLKVIENTDDNVDAYGELGNVYFNQGKNKQAASAYYEAAAILVRKGQVARANNLMDLLRHLDNSKAIDLQKLIESKQS